MPIVAFVIFGAVFVFIFVMVIKGIKNHISLSKDVLNSGKEIFKEVKSAYNLPKIETPAKKSNVCEYCGSIIAEGETKCASCGAKTNKKYSLVYLNKKSTNLC